VALAASSGPAGEVDLDAYERLLPEVRVSTHQTERNSLRRGVEGESSA
jgi:hypothetical protein